MPQERSEAVVLRGVDFSETSRIVTFLTPGRGKLACMALGARRAKGGMGGLLDTLNRLEVVYYWKDGRQVQKLGEVSLLNGYGDIKNQLEKSLYVAFPLELVYKVAHENEPSEALFETLVDGLESLTTWTGDVRTHTCRLVLALLSVAGFAPTLEQCAVCTRPLDRPTGFSYEGGVTCAACHSDVRLSLPDYEVLRRLAAPWSGNVEGTVTNAVYRLLRNYTCRQLETDLKSVRVIDQVLGERR